MEEIRDETMKKDQNLEKFRTMDKKKYEGKCIGLANGKVVVTGKDPVIVMDELVKNFSDKEIMVTSIPRKDVNFVLW